MKKHLPRALAGLFLVTALIVACSKDKNNSTPKTKTQLLTQASWKFSSAKASGTDITSLINSCYKDNIITFNATGGTGTIDEGTTVCSPSTAGNFTWAFQTGETQINISATLIQGGTGVFNIVSLTETNLVLSQTVTIPPNPATNVEVTFIH